MLYRAGLLANHLGFIQRLMLNSLAVLAVSSLVTIVCGLRSLTGLVLALAALWSLEVGWFLVWTLIWFRKDTSMIREKYQKVRDYVEGSLVPASDVGPRYIQMRKLAWDQTDLEFKLKHIKKAERYSELIGQRVVLHSEILKYYDPGLRESFWTVAGVELMLLIKLRASDESTREELALALCDLSFRGRG